ncbi:protein trapped in endoderm-1 [Cryptotermes secundus]|uniref:protein trapped in endoderm-1 n=1 Tax=Cryptotermes secundus TaxID=105785 RepID=UPI000CD7B34B|nr:protein trapped in endoderm-1 [Cryptotermes secundus]XP_023714847.1 protein trapped in endoderm-1 [Cryptotermes secundus]XP_033608935.1 protein trapped in endoderm-1 [Cryptotermes secundus]
MTDNYTVADSVEIYYPRGATVFASVCAVLFSIVGVIGNLITAIALLCCSKLRHHATTAFIISLCVSDLLFCSINLPLTASRYINQAWVLGSTLCKLFPFFFYGNVAVSLLSMVAITINRYILISCHSLYDKLYTPRNICLMLVFAWSFSFSMMIPPLLEVWGHLGLDPPTFSCTILKKDGKSPKKMLFVLGFILPCVVIILSYTCIYWKVRQSQRNLQSHNAVRPKPNSVGPQFLQRREDIRLTRLMLTIFCCFLLCFLPLMLVNVADDEIHYPTIHVMASVLAWASSVVNPFIYAGSNRQYRAAYHKLLCCVGSPGHGDTDYQTGAPAEGGGLTHSHSGSGKTFITDMFQYNAATDNVHTVRANGNE